jgi:2-C-methyl-D-erythritol 2,4-cyclodiphosphate synthase
MFERYTEQARRVIFFARYEASQSGDPQIRCVHLLLGLQREAHTLLRDAGLGAGDLQKICEALGLHRSSHPIPTNVEIPLDDAAGRALASAAKASERFQSRLVVPEHLLWGVFHADTKLRKLFEEFNVTENTLVRLCATPRIEIRKTVHASHAVRSGIGYDLHRLEPGSKLMIGGIEVPFDRGSIGHSDGDVLAHAICDALLGAAGLGDIGTHFPDNDPQWKGVSSLVFLQRMRELLARNAFRIVHIDAVVIAEQPKLAPYFESMRTALADALGILPEQINLKAKTNEGVGELGRSEAIAAHAIATLEA